MNLDELLRSVDKPARYTGGEVNSIVKPGPVRARVALCFPDLYEVAESHIGLKILYDILNRIHDVAAERVYALGPDLEALVQQAQLPLWSLETRTPLKAFDVVGFTLQYELSYATILAMLELGGITVHAAERAEHEPIVIGGGAGAYNPEPIAPFFDAFLLGDGEDAIVEMVDAVAAARQAGLPRADILRRLARVPGVYVPSHFEITYDGLHIASITTAEAYPGSKHGTPRVARRTLIDLDSAPYPTKQIVPNVKPVHERVAIEIQRGCSQACRFCQAGMITRPTRQRRPETILKLADEALKATGCDEVGLLSLSAGDYEPMNHLLSAFFERYENERVAVALPSMRTETMTPELAEQVATVRKGGWTFAPEAGSERMRNVINKTNREEDLLNAVRATVQAGWRSLKFYFQIGLPTERQEDLDAIVSLAVNARSEGRKIRRDVDVVVNASTFVPKPHTAFQWEQQLSLQQTRDKLDYLRDKLRQHRIRMRYHDPEHSFLDGVLSRGDRRLAPAILQAARSGARLDAWTEHHKAHLWLDALQNALQPLGLSAHDYLSERREQSLLPWDHLDAGILKKFLVRDRRRAYQEGVIADCAFSEQCTACGGCDLGDPYLPRGNDGKREVLLKPVIFKELEHKPQKPAPRPAPGPHKHKLRFRYAKLGRAVHLSQLEVSEQLLRAVRQAELPVIFSQGYSPKPLVSFSPACPTGIESHAEYMELDCHGHPDARQSAEALKPFLPDGLFILEADEWPIDTPAVGSLIESLTYLITPSDPAAVQRFLESPRVLVKVVRKEMPRVYDARLHVRELFTRGESLELTLGTSGSGSLKIGEAAAAVLGTSAQRRIVKERVSLADKPIYASGDLPVVVSSEPVLDLTHLSDRRRPVELGKKPAGATVPYAE